MAEGEETGQLKAGLAFEGHSAPEGRGGNLNLGVAQNATHWGYAAFGPPCYFPGWTLLDPEPTIFEPRTPFLSRTPSVFQEIFQKWDRDGSGDISVAELTRVLTKLRLAENVFLAPPCFTEEKLASPTKYVLYVVYIYIHVD